MLKIIFSILFLLIISPIFALEDNLISGGTNLVVNGDLNPQDVTIKKSPLQVQIEILNQTKKLNDGIAIAKVTGGIPPYTYKWTNEETDTTSKMAEELVEGKLYMVTVIDAVHNSVIAEVTIPPESVDEKINSGFFPVVKVMEKVLMFDLFAFFHLYDPTIHDDNGNIMYHPNGEPRKMKIPFVVVWLMLGALYFTLKMRFINFRGFRHAISLVAGKFDNPKNKGEVSHFQALATALSATVGLGNIAGVAIAIVVGGPGATFWMIVAGFLGMSSKFVECTLGLKYRIISKSGEVSGGAMYYLSRALKKKKLGGLGKVLAGIFGVLVIGASFGGGNMFQVNQAFAQVTYIFPGIEQYGAYFGIAVAILVGIVIIGGIKSIARVTEKIVPFMAILYVTIAIVIIFMHFSDIGKVFSMIFTNAFNPSALKGGFIGVLITGFQRAAFSNEAGVGSASIAHSAAKTDKPVSEGIVALLEPFIDTVVICTMTALVIIFTGSYENPQNLEGTQLTSQAFGSVFSWSPYILVIAIFLFAFSTMISWSYYGLIGFNYLLGGISEKWFGSKKVSTNVYFVFFLVFIVIGSSSSLGAVLDFADMMILSMAFPNILGLIILAPEVKRDLKEYLKKVKSGEIKRYK